MRDNLSDSLSLKLQKDIFKNKYPVGGKIPSERELAVSYGVSRITVRDAVRKLTGLGLLKKIPQSGTFVNDYRNEASIELLLSIIRSTSHIDADILESLLEIRKVVEIYLAGKSVSLFEPADIENLRLLVKKMESDIGNPRVLSDTDIRIHEIIINRAGNLLVKLVFNSIMPLYSYYVNLFYSLDGSTGIITHYKKLLDAVTRRDPDLASNSMEKILIFAENHVREALIPARDGNSIDISKIKGRI
jgi:GntR family transcriptional regulator, transcriptional repressor for pyruvate dehydrogenase complex